MLQKTDKACGKSFIAEGQKCSKTPITRATKEKGASSGKGQSSSLKAGAAVTAIAALSGAALLAREYRTDPEGYQQALIANFQDALQKTGARVLIPKISSFVEGLTQGSPSDVDRKAAIGFNAAAKLATVPPTEEELSNSKLKAGKERLEYSERLMSDPLRGEDYKLALSKFADRKHIPPYPEELAAMYYYSDTVGYKEMNMTLRGQDKELNSWLKTQEWRPNDKRSPEQVKKQAKEDIDMAVSGLERLPPFEGKTYRGLNLPDDVIDSISEGGDWEEKGFTSTTKTATTRYPGNVVFVVNGKGTGRDISAFEKYKNDEVLYPPGAKFKVTRKRQVDKLGQKFWIVEMEEHVKGKKDSRFDKACGKSFIGEGQKCSKTPVSRPSGNLSPAQIALGLTPLALGLAGTSLPLSPRTKILLGTTGAALSLAALGALKIAAEVKSSNLPPGKIPPYKPPVGLYDTFQPGDLIYHGVNFAGGKKAHFGVYVGKINGEHSIFDTAGSQDQFGSVANVRSLNDTGGSSFRKVSRVSNDRPVPSTEQLFKIIEQAKGKHVDWTGFEQNCETYARTIVNDLPVSTGSKNVSVMTAKITRVLVDAAIQHKSPGYKKTALKQSTLKRTVERTMKTDAMINPKERAERILSPLFNNRPVSVMSVSLTPEGIPTGVFKGMVTPGISRYYTFRMGNQIEYKRIMPKGDGLTKTHKVMREFKEGTLTTHGKPVTNRKQAIAIALSEQARVKKKKRPRGEAFEKADALLARLDKKCGRSGISDNEKCSVGNAVKKAGRDIAYAALGTGVLVGGLLAYSRFKAFRAKAAERASNPYGLGEDQKTSLAVYQYAQRNGYDKSFFTRQIKSSSSPSQRRFAKQDLNNFISGEKIHRKNIADSDIITWAQALDNVAPDSLSRKGSPLESANDRQSAVSSVYDASSQSPVFRGEGIHIRKNKTHFTSQVITNEKDSLGRAAPILIHGKVTPGWEHTLYTEAFRASKEIGRSFDDSTRRSLDDFFSGNKNIKRGKTDAVPYGIWYKNRTTPVVVNAESSDEARSKGSDRRKESYGAITAVKALKGADAKAARRGDWVRTRASGKSPEESTQKSKIRPQFFDAEDPCWEGYEQVGMKRKGGKMVPNCVPIKEKTDELLARLDKKCGGSGIPDGANCHQGEGAAQEGPPGRNQKAAERKAESWRQKNPKQASLLTLSLAIGTYAAIGAIKQVVANRMAENYIKKDFGVSAEEARQVRKTVQEKSRREGRSSAERYYRWYARKNDERLGREGPSKEIDKNWHKTLGVSLDALGAEIKAAFRKKAKASHPDAGGSNEEFLKVQKAWESAQATGKFKRGDSIEMEGFLRRLDASCCKQCEDDEMDVKRKADELLARLDQKCGNSGIPDGAKCSKGGGTGSRIANTNSMLVYHNGQYHVLIQNKPKGAASNPGSLSEKKEKNPTLVKRGNKYLLLDHPSEVEKGDKVQDKLPPEAGSAFKIGKKSGRGKKILKGALIGLGALTAANIAAGTALNVGYGIAASRRKRGDDSQDKADALLARLDVKCGKGAISFGEKCHSSAVRNPIAKARGLQTVRL
jgi:hypothetical protein